MPENSDFKPLRIAVWGVSGIVAALALWLVLASALWGLRVATAGIYGQGEARIQIHGAANRIASYEHFFNLCAAIQGQEAQIDALEHELSQYPDGSKDRSRTLTNLTGVEAARGRSIAQYNADARKDYTSGQFRDSDLPFQLDPTAYPEGGNTSCVAD